MRRLAAGVLGVVSVASVAVLADTASAQPPAGSVASCPPRYQAMTLPDILAQAERNDIPEDDARAMFARINKNADDWICQDPLPGDPRTSYNFVDNQAVGRD